MQLGVGFGHDFQYAVVLHQREALHPQSRLQGLQRLIFRHRIFGHEIQLTFHARVDDDRLPSRGTDRLRYLIDIRIDEIQCHLCVRKLRGDKSSHQQSRRYATQCHTFSSHGV